MIKNAIVCWTTCTSSSGSKGLTYLPEKQRGADTIGCHAMISWRRANRLGEYAISDERLRNTVSRRCRST